MRQKLLKDVLIVFAMWFVIGYYASGLPASYAADVGKGVAIIWLLGGSVGLGGAWLRRRWGVHRAQASIAGAGVSDGNASATIMDGDEDRTLYEVALPIPTPPAMGRGAGNPIHKLDWWPKYEAAHPEYAAVIDDVYAVMQSRPGMPAGIDFHQGATLVEHSLDVVNKMLELAPSWKFEGIKNASGAIIAPVQTPDGAAHTFGDGSAIAAPLLPVAAFAHDVGKVVCLVDDDHGNPVMLHGHGLKGAEILRTLPSVGALPMEERDAILLAVKYYHALTHIPLAEWVGDLARSLASLLYTADSQSEFNRTRDGELAEPLPAPAPVTVDPAPVAVDENQVPAAAATDQPTEAPAYVTESGATPLDVLQDALAESDTVNGKSLARRLAWKHGEWVYVCVGPFAAWAKRRLNDSGLVPNAPATNMFLATLLSMLASEGWLYLGDPARAPGDAVWTTASSSTGDVSEANQYKTIVITVAAAPHLANIDDCRYPPMLLDSDAGELANPKPATTTGEDPVVEEMDAAVDGDGDGGDFLADFVGRSVVAESRGLDKLDGAKKCDTVAHRRNKNSDARHGKRTLTAGILAEYAKSKTAMYGHETVIRNEFEFHLFDAQLLETDFAFDRNNLPTGVVARIGERDGRTKLVVAP